jgi:hypothetical protein
VKLHELSTRLPLPIAAFGTAVTRGLREARRARRAAAAIRAVRPLTMVESPSLLDLVGHVERVVMEGVPGAFVECGVWRGGSAFLMARVARELGDPRTVWLCDSFEGLPDPEEIDGEAAVSWARARDPANFFDNCRADLEAVERSARELGLEGQTRFVKGWFDQTLPAVAAEIGPIALLRIDADWHSSVSACLQSLYDPVSPGGIVVFDDYYSWDGCAIAVHEFLAGRRLPHRIERGGSAAWFRKT